jgi:putative transposase
LILEQNNGVISTIDELRYFHKKWVEEILKTKNYVRESKWTESIAIGSKNIVQGIKKKFGVRAKSRKVEGSRGLYHLCEVQAAYKRNFTPEHSVLSAKNT